MSAKEILESYKNARDPAAQVRILAELNAVTPGEIEEVLRGLGAELPERKRRGRKPKEQTPEAAEQTPVEVEQTPVEAEQIPVEAEQGPEEQAEAERETMSVAALGEVLRRVAEAYPGTELHLAEGCREIRRAQLTVYWDARGEAARTVLEIGG